MINCGMIEKYQSNVQAWTYNCEQYRKEIMTKKFGQDFIAKYIIKSFSLDEELIKKISLLAKKQHVSISLLVNQLIEKALKDTKEN